MPDTPNAIRGKVKTIIRLRINSDGEGVRSVVFLYGCPLSCKWCCNPETRTGDQYREVTARQLLDLIVRDLIYFQESGGGITFSGGEPLMQYAFIREFALLTRGLFPISLETSLFAPRQAVETLMPHIDHWYIDFKAPSDALHREFTGVPQAPILENLAFLAENISPERITMTYPVIPGFTATESCADALIRVMGTYGITRTELHPHRKACGKKYAPLGLEVPDIPALSQAEYAQIRARLRAAGLNTEGSAAILERRKCDVLKAYRREVCSRHGIPTDIPDCTYRGRCPGTCPKCEQELAQINAWLYQHDKFPLPPESDIP